jgi:hypothetical protein
MRRHYLHVLGGEFEEALCNIRNGVKRLYDVLNANPMFYFYISTHSSLQRTAVNLAPEVDLSGQTSSRILNDRQPRGSGFTTDTLSTDGAKAIITLWQHLVDVAEFGNAGRCDSRQGGAC